jgi:hypothetical protein
MRLTTFQDALFDEFQGPFMFKDVRIFSFKKTDDQNDYLAICKGDYHFLTLATLSSETVKYAMINNGSSERSLFCAIFEENALSQFGLLGNNNKTVSTCEPMGESGLWHRFSYCKKDDGRFKGEMYLDIDFDGQMDLKRFFDDDGKITSTSIYKDQQWHKTSHYKYDSSNAPFKVEVEIEEIPYIFEYDKGWLKQNVDKIDNAPQEE